ncbi:MAG: hypothetical protein AB7H43_08570 [Acidimicrobiia bacterium]
MSSSIRPEPTDEEAAAIAAAVEVLWPRPGHAPPAEPTPAWRFSGRWWVKPVAARRQRPW